MSLARACLLLSRSFGFSTIENAFCGTAGLRESRGILAEETET